jgi:hypothetical protein
MGSTVPTHCRASAEQLDTTATAWSRAVAAMDGSIDVPTVRASDSSRRQRLSISAVALDRSRCAYSTQAAMASTFQPRELLHRDWPRPIRFCMHNNQSSCEYSPSMRIARAISTYCNALRILGKIMSSIMREYISPSEAASSLSDWPLPLVLFFSSTSFQCNKVFAPHSGCCRGCHDFACAFNCRYCAHTYTSMSTTAAQRQAQSCISTYLWHNHLHCQC